MKLSEEHQFGGGQVASMARSLSRTTSGNLEKVRMSRERMCVLSVLVCGNGPQGSYFSVKRGGHDSSLLGRPPSGIRTLRLRKTTMG
jgi:hypothetical protein